MADLEAARKILKSSLEESRHLSFQINKIGFALEESKQRLSPIESSVKIIAKECSILKIIRHIDHAVGPATDVLKVFDVVNGLEISLLHNPCSNLFHYLSLVKQLQEALKFLTSISGLVILWLEDILQFLEDNKAEDDWYLLNVRKSMRILRELQTMEGMYLLDGQPLFNAMEKLQTEFRHILIEHTFPTSYIGKGDISTPPLPDPVIQKLQAIVKTINDNDRIANCVSIYAEVRSSNAKATMEALDLDYLELSISDFDSAQGTETYIDQWGTQLEYVVKHVLELEYRLCNKVFEKVDSDIWMNCFSEIAARSGIQRFIKFGNAITRGKKDAIKLLKLLDIFAALNRLRLDFNRIFGGKACAEIQKQTRNLIKKVVDGACGIFWELSVQVELQRGSTPPPMDGSVPRLVSFVTEYCCELLEDDYKPIMIQVLEIHMSWKDMNFEESLLSNEVHKILREIELNLERWAKTYEDSALSNIFMMNNQFHLSKNLRGSKLGDLMGDAWLKTHEKATEYYAAMYLRESWGMLPVLLSDDDGLVPLTGARIDANDLVRKRLKEFNKAFDSTYKRQTNWVISDKGLRWKMCELVAKMIVPVYRSFMLKYNLVLVEQETSPNKNVKYSAEALENMVRCMFQPKLGKCSNSMKCTNLIGNIQNIVISHFSSSAAAAARVF